MSADLEPSAARGPRVYATQLDAERRGWYEVVGLVRSLQPEECLVPGYYRDPDWTVRDVIAHLGTWQAEAETQFEQMTAGTYQHRDVDIEGLNAALLEAMARSALGGRVGAGELGAHANGR